MGLWSLCAFLCDHLSRVSRETLLSCLARENGRYVVFDLPDPHACFGDYSDILRQAGLSGFRLGYGNAFPVSIGDADPLRAILSIPGTEIFFLPEIPFPDDGKQKETGKDAGWGLII